MTIDEAQRQRAARLARCRTRAERLGHMIEESPGGFRLLAPGASRRGRELGLPQIEQRLAELERQHPANKILTGETPWAPTAPKSP